MAIFNMFFHIGLFTKHSHNSVENFERFLLTDLCNKMHTVGLLIIPMSYTDTGQYGL